MTQSEKIEGPFRAQLDEVDGWLQYVDALLRYQERFAEAKKELQHRAIKRLTSLTADGVLNRAKEARSLAELAPYLRRDYEVGSQVEC
jgi:hypothetical protein